MADPILLGSTGVQFLEIPLNLEGEWLDERYEFAELYSNGGLRLAQVYRMQGEMFNRDGLPHTAFLPDGTVDKAAVDVDMCEKIDASIKTYRVTLNDAVGLYVDRWIPIPYFKRRMNDAAPFEPGPYSWCRGMLQEKRDDEHTHVLVLAFDTTIAPLNEGDKFELLREEDAKTDGGLPFQFVHDHRHLGHFYKTEKQQQWLTNEFDRKYPDSYRKYQRDMEPLAFYLSFLSAVRRSSDHLPEVLVQNKPADNHIDVSLILDIGNSRTCGVLVPFTQVVGGTMKIENARPLRLRNLSRPAEWTEEPFDMQMSFCEETFHDDSLGELNRISLSKKVFRWPSVVRLGQEAHELAKKFHWQDGQCTISSPKRYLWDTEKPALRWCHVKRNHTPGMTSQSVISGIASHFSDDGEFNRNDTLAPATSSYFPRKTLMSFAIGEVVLQALSQMNSHDYRREIGDEPYTRRLKHVVVTCPTAMTQKEQKLLRLAAEEAILALKRDYPGYHWSETVEVIPSPHRVGAYEEDEAPEWTMDEASCSQLAFLHGELMHHWSGETERYFRLRGKLRKWDASDAEASQVLRMASLDIGGGTSDLMISDYRNHPGLGQVMIEPKPVFWEGFGTAGDDIAKGIIERHVFIKISQALKDAGGERVSEFIHTLFGSNVANLNNEERQMKIRFTQRLALPAAYGVLRNRAEHADIAGYNLCELAGEREADLYEIQEYCKTKAKAICGVAEFDILGVQMDLKSTEVDQTIRVVMKKVIHQLGALIASLDCDVVLLTGRPSGLPVIRKMLKSISAVPSSRIVSLGDYQIGNWYPFSDGFGKIVDPKTTVVVGAAIAHLCRNRKLSNFQINENAMRRLPSTANFLGVMDNAKETILETDLVFAKGQAEGNVVFSGSDVYLGFRQFNSEKWVAAPLYKLTYKTNAGQKLQQLGMHPPFKVTLERDEDNLETLRVVDAEDKNGDSFSFHDYLQFVLNTMRENETYWKDSGQFSTDWYMQIWSHEH